MKTRKLQGKSPRAIGGSVQRSVRRQALDEANHVSHDMRISAMGTGLTVGQVRRMLDQLNVPDDAKIKFAIGQSSPGWALLESLSFCRPANEVSLW
jgi:hypothetical protein